jgi:hypothetical protein
VTSDVEAVLARHTVRRAVVVGPAAVLALWAVRGSDGAVAAAIGVTIVVVNFLLSGLVLSAAARISLALYHAAALFGFVLRLVLITVVMVVVARQFDIDRLAFGMAAVATYLVLLVLEAVAVARGKERDLELTA